MNFRSAGILAGSVAIVCLAIVAFGMARQSGTPAEERPAVEFESKGSGLASLSSSPQSLEAAIGVEPATPPASQAPDTDGGTSSTDRRDEPDSADSSGMDHETGWSYATRMRAEHALYETLNQPEIRQAAYMDKFACGDGKCRFELGLVQARGAASVVSDFMADFDARLLADDTSAGVQVYLERLGRGADGMGLAVLTIDSRSESSAKIEFNPDTQAPTISFPRRTGDGD